MKKSNFGNKIKSIYIHLIKKYNKQITDNMKNAIKIILTEKDIDNRNMLITQVKNIYQLTDKQLEEYMLVIKLEMLYIIMLENLRAITELLNENPDLFNDMNEEILEINNMRQEIESILVKIDEITKQTPTLNPTDVNEYQELSSVSNFIILLDSIEEDRINTMEAKSGKERMTMTSIVKEIKLLMNSNYELLRRNAKIHQINDVNKTQILITEYNLAYERIGSGTTKVSYIRIPICNENIALLNRKYNNNSWRYLILIIGFGDFKNEGISEGKLYDLLRRKSINNIDEINQIVKIFSEPFNEETFEIACNYIENGFDNIKCLDNNPEEVLPNHKTNNFIR